MRIPNARYFLSVVCVLTYGGIITEIAIRTARAHPLT
jgi:hypothetical protein